MPDIMLNRDIKAVETTIFNPSHQAQLNDVLLYPTVHICGCSIAQDTWDSVIICIEFKLWRYHGKANSSVLMFWFWVCMLCGFTRNGEFWQFSVSSEVCFLLIPTYSCVDGCSAFPQKAMFREEKERAKTGQKKKRVKEYEQGGESDTFTPSCQFACGPPSLWVLGCFFCPPLSPCLVLSLKSKPGYVVSEEMKAGEGRDERLGKTWGWKCGDGQRIDGSAKILCHPSKSRWSQRLIKIQNKLW